MMTTQTTRRGVLGGEDAANLAHRTGHLLEGGGLPVRRRADARSEDVRTGEVDAFKE